MIWFSYLRHTDYSTSCNIYIIHHIHTIINNSIHTKTKFDVTCTFSRNFPQSAQPSPIRFKSNPSNYQAQTSQKAVIYSTILHNSCSILDDIAAHDWLSGPGVSGLEDDVYINGVWGAWMFRITIWRMCLTVIVSFIFTCRLQHNLKICYRLAWSQYLIPLWYCNAKAVHKTCWNVC